MSGNLSSVDWSAIPAPDDDGGARHLTGMVLPPVMLEATDGSRVDLSRLRGCAVIFAYPRTGTPAQIGLTDDWDMIPGARGCTPQSCAFRDLHQELTAAGATSVYGLSTQDTAYQAEMVERLHLPFPVLSDAKLELAKALNLPTMIVAGQVLLKRMTMIVRESRIVRVFYPVFPPDRNAGDVLAWLQDNQP